MAPVVAALVSLLALAGTLDAKPLLTPGRHAKPGVANLISNSRRSFHKMLARYYGFAHGLVSRATAVGTNMLMDCQSKPPALPTKRSKALPAGWTYLGCVAESTNQRLLEGFAFSSEILTPLMCLTECASLGYTIGGTEYGDEVSCERSSPR